jgi:serine/threonine protein kinase
MGAVYRARDTKLDRDVAIKVLPPELMADEMRRRRFVQEAKAAAAVHHPHVATIHEIDEADGIHFLVMELISGEKLSDVLARQRLPVVRTLELAAELVEGLSRAHEKRVVHRDLKPANVMLTEDGHVKIIDFGLAKLLDPFRPPISGESEAETGVRGETHPGEILGTVSYMSPEQARGETVDHRSDVFSFGIILYEMLAGTLPFQGKSATDVLSAILRDPTPRLSGEHAEELQHVVNRCLAKDPEERYQTTKDLLADIRRIKRDTESGVRTVAKAPPQRRILWALPGVLLLGTGLLVVLWPRGPEPFRPRVGRTMQITRDPGLEIDATISPDGKFVAYAAGARGATKIHVRQVAGGRPVSLADDLTGEQRFPRWSPDGSSISFRRGLEGSWETYIVPALGGAPRRFPIPDGFTRGLVWSPDGDRIAYPTFDAIYVGPPDGGEAVKLADAVDPSCLTWSSDGKRIAFTSENPGYLANLNAAPSFIWVVDVEGGEAVRVTEGRNIDYSPVWTPDGRSLLFVSDRGGGRDVYHVPLGAAGEPLSEPERLTTGLDVFTMSSSADGRTLSYSVASLRQNIWSLPIPAEGEVSVQDARPITTGNQRIEGVDLSFDGKWLVFNSDQAGGSTILKMPVGGGEPVQLTNGPMDLSPFLSRDGLVIAFHGIRTGSRDVFTVSIDGGPVRQLTNDPAQEFYPHWSPNGKSVVFHSNRNGAVDLYVVANDGGELAGETPLRLTFDSGYMPSWSPDGRLVAYASESGLSVIPSGGGTPRRLAGPGSFPTWSKDSRTIYFMDQRRDEDKYGLWSVSLSGGDAKRIVRFDDPVKEPYASWWVTDGERFYFSLIEFESDVWVMELEDSE